MWAVIPVNVGSRSRNEHIHDLEKDAMNYWMPRRDRTTIRTNSHFPRNPRATRSHVVRTTAAVVVAPALQQRFVWYACAVFTWSSNRVMVVSRFFVFWGNRLGNLLTRRVLASRGEQSITVNESRTSTRIFSALKISIILQNCLRRSVYLCMLLLHGQ